MEASGIEDAEIAIEHYRESRIPGRRLNEREKRMEHLKYPQAVKDRRISLE
jgi:hypothetical protein